MDEKKILYPFEKEKVETAQEGGNDSGSDSDVTIANDVLDRENPESDSDEECLI